MRDDDYMESFGSPRGMGGGKDWIVTYLTLTLPFLAFAGIVVLLERF